MRPPDAAFADPRLAVLYDVLEDDRPDLDAYAAIVRELGARSVVDIGCGTGSLAVRPAADGPEVVGVGMDWVFLAHRERSGGDR